MKHRVLLIDSDDVFRYLVKAQLRSEGFDVVSARSGGRGRLLAAEVEPDIILLDVGVSSRGLAVLSDLLTTEESCWVPVIVLGRRDQLSIIEEAISMGAQDFLIKPLGIGGLGRFLEEHIGGEGSVRGTAEMVQWAQH